MYKKMAEDFRRYLLLKKGFVDLIVNRKKRKVLALKVQWASTHDTKMTKTHSFLAWALALVRKRTVKNVLSKRFNSLSLEEGGPQGSTLSDDESDSCDFSFSDLLQENDQSGKLSRYREKRRLLGARWTAELKGVINEDDEDLRSFDILRGEVLESMRNCFHISIQGLEYDIERIFSTRKELDGYDGRQLNTMTPQIQRNQSSLSARSISQSNISPNEIASERLSTQRQQNQHNEKDYVKESTVCDTVYERGVIGGGLLKSLQTAVSDNRYLKNKGDVSENDGSFIERGVGGMFGTKSVQEPSGPLGEGLLRRALNISSPGYQHPKGSVIRDIRNPGTNIRNSDTDLGVGGMRYPIGTAQIGILDKVYGEKLSIGKLGYLKGYLKGHIYVSVYVCMYVYLY
jgi:hypothetical protein